MVGPEFGVMRGILALAVVAFAAGAAVIGLAVWLWPYLPSVRLIWGSST